MEILLCKLIIPCQSQSLSRALLFAGHSHFLKAKKRVLLQPWRYRQCPNLSKAWFQNGVCKVKRRSTARYRRHQSLIHTASSAAALRWYRFLSAYRSTSTCNSRHKRGLSHTHTVSSRRNVLKAGVRCTFRTVMGNVSENEDT